MTNIKDMTVDQLDETMNNLVSASIGAGRALIAKPAGWRKMRRDEKVAAIESLLALIPTPEPSITKRPEPAGNRPSRQVLRAFMRRAAKMPIGMTQKAWMKIRGSR